MLRTSSVLAVIATVALIMAGCDGRIGVEGHVYRWNDPPAGTESTVMLQSEPPSNLAIEPLPGVEVLFAYDADGIDPRIINSSWQSTLVTDEQGRFGGRFFVCSPSLKEGEVYVGPAGFRHAKGKVPRRADITQVVVLLVPES